MRGFTLIEIVVVAALIALIAVAISVSVGEGLTGARIRAAGKDLVAALRYTRSQAIVRRETQVLTLDVEQRSYQALERKPVQLPKDMEMRLLTARDELIDDGVGRIRFFPDGSSTGGRITLVYGEAAWRVEVEWLTGKVKLLTGSEQ